jgi:ribonuclease/clavin/mitogillin
VGTIIIDPPEGDMRLYLRSLERLRGLGARWLLPAHGAPVSEPDMLLGHYLRHRLDREARVLDALSPTPTPIPDLVPRAYPDVAPAIYPLAARSLLAHLLKLRDEGRAIAIDGDEAQGAWRLA